MLFFKESGTVLFDFDSDVEEPHNADVDGNDDDGEPLKAMRYMGMRLRGDRENSLRDVCGH